MGLQHSVSPDSDGVVHVDPHLHRRREQMIKSARIREHLSEQRMRRLRYKFLWASISIRRRMGTGFRHIIFTVHIFLGIATHCI